MVHLEQKAGDSSSERLWMTSSLGTKPWPRMSDCQVLRQLVYGIGEKNFHQHGTKIFLKKKTWNKNPILVKVNRP